MEEKDREVENRFNVIFGRLYQSLGRIIKAKNTNRYMGVHKEHLLSELHRRDADVLRRLRNRCKETKNYSTMLVINHFAEEAGITL